MNRHRRLAGAFLTAVLGLAAPAMGAGPSLAMLGKLDAGQWEIRAREPGARPARMCLPDASRIIQLRHPGMPCDRYVIKDAANEVTVQYTCRGRGYGWTNIRRETDQLVQIETRGISNGLPFEVSAEARRVGNCTGA